MKMIITNGNPASGVIELAVLQDKHVKELISSFQNNRVFPNVHPYDLYRDWLDAVWAFLNTLQEPEKFKELDKYSNKEGAELGRLFNIYTSAVEELQFQDILGELFMELDVKSVRAGQLLPGLWQKWWLT